MSKSVFTDAYRTFLAVLIGARRNAGVTQNELAKRLGKPQPWVSNYERGIRRLDVIEFIAIAHAIGLKPRNLFAEVMAKMPDELEI